MVSDRVPDRVQMTVEFLRKTKMIDHGPHFQTVLVLQGLFRNELQTRETAGVVHRARKQTRTHREGIWHDARIFVFCEGVDHTLLIILIGIAWK